jgi:hypothetical protein
MEIKKTFFAILFFTAGVCFAETIIFGTITENTWWTTKNSPYILTNDLVIAPQARLVIEPGVEIVIEKPTRIPENITQIDRSDSFTVAIKVYGALHALGTPLNPIVFRGKDISEQDTYTHWFGILIDSKRTQEITIGYATVSSAVNGIWVKGGMPLIRNNLFEFNNVGLRLDAKSTARVVHCVFAQNYLAGIRVVDSNPYVYNSIIVNNNLIGLWGDKNTEIAFKNNLSFGNGRNYVDADPLLGRNSKVNANGDSTDTAGNLSCDPIFLGSVKEEEAKKSDRAEKKPSSQNILNEIVDDRYFLSTYSPCIDAGVSDKMFREIDGTLPDLGIWGGAEVIRF